MRKLAHTPRVIACVHAWKDNDDDEDEDEEEGKDDGRLLSSCEDCEDFVCVCVNWPPAVGRPKRNKINDLAANKRSCTLHEDGAKKDMLPGIG